MFRFVNCGCSYGGRGGGAAVCVYASNKLSEEKAGLFAVCASLIFLSQHPEQKMSCGRS